MKIILLQNIPKIGKKYEVKEVADGYATNYLIPNKLAMIADRNSLQWAKKQKDALVKKATKELEKFAQMAQKIEGLEVEIAVKVGDKGQFFEKVGPQKIANRLKEMGYDILKEQVDLPKTIDAVGEHEAKIAFEHNLESAIKIMVIPA